MRKSTFIVSLLLLIPKGCPVLDAELARPPRDVLAVLLLEVALARPVLDFVTTRAGIPDTPLTLFLIAGSIFLIMFFRFSVIISHLRDDNIALAQRVAILEYHLQSIHADEK